MCEPTTALAIASIASTAATAYSQDRAAKIQTQANQTQYDNTMTAMRFNLANANVTKQQEAENASQKIIENNAQVRRDQSKATVAAGEAGVSGLSVDALLAELGGAGGRANTNIRTQQERTDRAIEADKMNVWAGSASQINQLKTPQGADWLGAAVRIGTTVNDYYNPRVSDARTKRIGG